MWYTPNSNKKSLDYSKPIIAERDGGQMLLLPQQNPGEYGIIGYNWFRLTDGGYNSCTTWKTPEAAVEAYERYHAVHNAELTAGEL